MADRLWRWNRALHRDLGYAAVGLTLVYALSGLAVNHREQWNYDWRTVRETRALPPIAAEDDAGRVALVARALGEIPPREVRWTGPDRVELGWAGRSARVDLAAGVAVVEKKRPRVLVKPLNDLHLNRLEGAWTVVADVYAVVLAYLAVGGLFMLRGRNGLAGRGKWLLLAGLALPALALAWAAWG